MEKKDDSPRVTETSVESKPATPPQHTHQTSLRVFRQYIDVRPDGSLDASRLLSCECFEAWVRTRKNQTDMPALQKQFQRTISAHLTVLDGRVPFSEEEEEAVLREVRKKEVWACFKDLPNPPQIGVMGFRSKGFHEKQRFQSAVSSKKARLDYAAASYSTAEEQWIDRPLGGDSFWSSAAAAAPSLLPVPMFAPPYTSPLPHPPPKTFASQPEMPLKIVSSIDESFLSSIVNRMMSIATLPSFDAWKSMLGGSASMIEEKTSARLFSKFRTPEYARQLVHAISQSKGDEVFVLACDATQRDTNKLVFAQNARCVAMFGDLVGKAPVLEPNSELFNAALVIGAAFSNPGTEFAVNMHLRCADGVERLFHASCWVDPNSFLLVRVGMLAPI